MKVVVVSERWSQRADEGVLRFLNELAGGISRQHRTLVLYADGAVPEGLAAIHVPMGKRLVTAGLREELRSFAPDVVLYVPSGAATLSALMRCRRLERHAGGAAVAMISLQERRYGPLGRAVARRFRPSRLVVLSRRSEQFYRHLGFPVAVMPAGVDLERFRVADPDARRRIRGALGWPSDRRVALHVGHLAQSRGLELLSALAADHRYHVVLVASTRTHPDPSVQARLLAAGVEVRREYFPRVEEFYQAADVYLFPVTQGHGCIEFPLSVLEAMACNLRVVTTPFGGIADLFQEQEGLAFLHNDNELIGALERVFASPSHTRAAVARLGWDAAVSGLVESIHRGAA